MHHPINRISIIFQKIQIIDNISIIFLIWESPLSAPWVESSLTTSSNNGLPHFRPGAYQSSKWCDIWLGRYFRTNLSKKKVSICLSVTMAIMQIRSNFGQRGRHCWKLFLILPLFTRPLTVLYWIIAFLVFRMNQTFVFNLQWSKLLLVFITTAVNCFLFPFDQWSVLIIEWVPNLRSFELSNIIPYLCKFLSHYGWLTIVWTIKDSPGILIYVSSF